MSRATSIELTHLERVEAVFALLKEQGIFAAFYPDQIGPPWGDTDYLYAMNDRIKHDYCEWAGISEEEYMAQPWADKRYVVLGNIAGDRYDPVGVKWSEQYNEQYGWDGDPETKDINRLHYLEESAINSIKEFGCLRIGEAPLNHSGEGVFEAARGLFRKFSMELTWDGNSDHCFELTAQKGADR